MTDYVDSAQGREAAAILARVMEAMKSQSVSKAELARRTGFTRGYISMLFADPEGEGARREISMPNALHLAHAVGLIKWVDDQEGSAEAG